MISSKDLYCEEPSTTSCYIDFPKEERSVREFFQGKLQSFTSLQMDCVVSALAGKQTDLMGITDVLARSIQGRLGQEQKQCGTEVLSRSLQSLQREEVRLVVKAIDDKALSILARGCGPMISLSDLIS